MTIFFFVLKIIGIILLVLVLTLLLLISLVLFCPIKYKLNGENDRLQYKIFINISWMLFVLRVSGGLENESYYYQLRIFGYTLLEYPQREKKEQKTKKTKKRKKDQRTKKTIKKSNTLKSVEKLDSTKQVPKEIEITQEITANVKETQPARLEQRKQFEARNDKIEEKKKHNRSKNIVKSISLFLEKAVQKVKTVICKFKQIFINLKKSFEKAKDKISFLKEKYQEIMKQIKDSKNQDAIKHMWKEVKYLLFHFRPRKVTGEALFGTSDPALTGQITGGICLFPYLYSYDIHILPDFESDEFYVTSNFFVKGHIRLIHILCVGIRILFDKNIMKWIKKIL